MAYDIGPRIGIEGEAQFRQAINALNTSFRTLGTEMSAVTSQFDRNDRSSRALTAQSGVLNRQIETQRERLVQLNSGLAQATARYGENHRVTQGWQQAVNRANAELNNLERTLDANTRSIAIQNSSWTRLGQTLDSVGTRMKTVGAGMSSLGQKMAMGLTAPIVGAGVAAAKLASDLSENMNKVDVAFGKNSGEVKSWSKTTLQSFGISQGSALEMASLFGDMGTAMGQSTAEASKMSTGLVGLAGDLASFKNIGIDQAQDALKGIFTGEGESLKSLGIIMQDSTLKAFALATGQKKSYEEMNQAEKVALRYAFVMDATKNSQGDFARTSEGTANQTRIFGETMKELGANIGQYILPVVTPLITKLSEMAKGFGELGEGTKKTILVVAGVVAVVGPVLIVAGSLITALGTISSFLGLASTAAGVASVATAGVGTAVAGTAASAGAAALLFNPVTLAIAGIGLAAVGVGIALNQKVIPAVDLFGGQVSKATEKAVTAYMDLNTKVGVSLLSLQANNTTITAAIAKDMVTTFETMGTQIKAGRDKHYTEDLANLTKFYTDQGTLNTADAQNTLAKMRENNALSNLVTDQGLQQIKDITAKATAANRSATQAELDQIAAIKANMERQAIGALTASVAEQDVILERAHIQAKNITLEQASDVIAASAKQRDETINQANAEYQGVVNSIARQRSEGVVIADDEAARLIDAAERKRSLSISKAQEMHYAVVDELGKQNAEVKTKLDEGDGHIKRQWEALKAWFSGNPIRPVIITPNVKEGGAHSGGGTYSRATGDNNFPGGLTTMHERGYEVYNLPRGSQIYNHEASEDMVLKTAQEVARGVLNNSQQRPTVINFNGNYAFSGQDDMDYFMNRSAQLIQRRL